MESENLKVDETVGENASLINCNENSTLAGSNGIDNQNGGFVIYKFDFEKLSSNKDNYQNVLEKLFAFQNTEELTNIIKDIDLSDMLFADEFRSINYYVFKNGIEPSWEAPENIDGGSFMISFKNHVSSALLFRKIVDYFINDDFKTINVVGFMIGLRQRFTKIEIWISSIPENVDTDKEIKKEISKVFGTPIFIKFKNHRKQLDLANNKQQNE